MKTPQCRMRPPVITSTMGLGLPGVRGEGINASSWVDGTARPGVDKITFGRDPFDAAHAQFQPMTNQFTDNCITNGAVQQQQVERVVSQPERVSGGGRCSTLHMSTFIKFVSALNLLLPVVALAKGDGVGFSMEGTVTNISVSGDSIHFTFTGTFRISQFRGSHASVVEIDCKRGVSATVSQGDPFFAMSSDGRAGALRPQGELLKILKAAVEYRRIVRNPFFTRNTL